MASGGLKGLPHAIYFDANTLIGVNHTLKDPSLEAIISFATKYGIELVIPQVAWLEWLWSLFEGCQRRLNRLDDDVEYVGSVLGRSELQVKGIDRDSLLEKIGNAHEERAKDAGLKIIPMPDLKMRELLIEAIRKKGPFKSGGKGFRDAVILETAARHAADTYKNPVVLVISNDKAVQQSVKRLEEKGLRAAICSTKEALNVLNDALDRARKEVARLDEEAALRFLEKHCDEVFDFVRKAQVWLTGLKHRLYEAYKIGQPRLLGIEAVRPIAELRSQVRRDRLHVRPLPLGSPGAKGYGGVLAVQVQGRGVQAARKRARIVLSGAARAGSVGRSGRTDGFTAREIVLARIERLRTVEWRSKAR